MTMLVLIVPAFSDQAGQCRIVARQGDVRDALCNYRAEPRAWREVGLMDSRGSIRCIEPQFAEMRQDEPLTAGVVYEF